MNLLTQDAEAEAHNGKCHSALRFQQTLSHTHPHVISFMQYLPNTTNQAPLMEPAPKENTGVGERQVTTLPMRAATRVAG
jgi:hypothetical protein